MNDIKYTKVDDALFNVDLLTLDEAKRVIQNFKDQMNAIGAEVSCAATVKPAILVENINSLVKQTDERNKRILKRLVA